MTSVPAPSTPGRWQIITAETGQKGQDLVLDVLTVNRRTQALGQRLGMAEVARQNLVPPGQP